MNDVVGNARNDTDPPPEAAQNTVEKDAAHWERVIAQFESTIRFCRQELAIARQREAWGIKGK